VYCFGSRQIALRTQNPSETVKIKGHLFRVFAVNFSRYGEGLAKGGFCLWQITARCNRRAEIAEHQSTLLALIAGLIETVCAFLMFRRRNPAVVVESAPLPGHAEESA